MLHGAIAATRLPPSHFIFIFILSLVTGGGDKDAKPAVSGVPCCSISALPIHSSTPLHCFHLFILVFSFALLACLLIFLSSPAFHCPRPRPRPRCGGGGFWVETSCSLPAEEELCLLSFPRWAHRLWLDSCHRDVPLRTSPLGTSPLGTSPLRMSPLGTSPLRTSPLGSPHILLAQWQIGNKSGKMGC